MLEVPVVSEAKHYIVQFDDAGRAVSVVRTKSGQPGTLHLGGPRAHQIVQLAKRALQSKEADHGG